MTDFIVLHTLIPSLSPASVSAASNLARSSSESDGLELGACDGAFRLCPLSSRCVSGPPFSPSQAAFETAVDALLATASLVDRRVPANL